MPARYVVELIQSGRNADVATVENGIVAAVQRLGLHTSASVVVGGTPTRDDISVAVLLGGPQTAADSGCNAAVKAALDDLRLVIPVVDDLATYIASVPPAAAPLNGAAWVPGEPPDQLVHLVLEELGIEERRRRVFISHRRTDGLMMAEQLFDELNRHGFESFIDRFQIPPGGDVQGEIADALEDYAFVVFIESPDAHTSNWVFDEVMYATTHSIGVHIVTFPGAVTALPASDRLPRQKLRRKDVRRSKGYTILRDAALDATIKEIEQAHAEAMVLRRRTLLRSVEDAAEIAGRTCTPLGDWRLLVEAAGSREVVQVATRLPFVDDLFHLDSAVQALNCHEGVLVHASREVPTPRADVLQWAVDQRTLSLIPENAIGARW